MSTAELALEAQELSFPGYDGPISVYQGNTFGAEEFVGVPFLVTDWHEKEGDFGPYVQVDVVTRDGTTGSFLNGAEWPGCIADVLRMHEVETGRRSGLVAPRGLRMGKNKKGDAPIYAFA